MPHHQDFGFKSSCDLKQSHSTRTKRKAIANIQQSCSDSPAIANQWMEFSEPTASVPSNHNQFSVAFTTNIAESNFRYTQDQEPAVAVRQPDPALHLTPQNNQLTAK